ncbi:MAG: alpha/beta hydrolase, partial [Anaerolineae bacterium]|nr:alpha/beta hydrolase [Anaerolineae bacterium]
LRSSPAQLLKSWYIFWFQLPWLPEAVFRANDAHTMETMMKRGSQPGTFSEEDFAHYHEAWRQPGAITAMLNWYRAAARLRSQAARIHVPTLILWGMHDIALSHPMATASQAYCDDCQLVWFEEATHWVQHDEPERVSQHLIEFFT